VTELPADVLARPAEEAVRLVALHQLDAAAAALERLDRPDDAEALHDFRVALRRLRSLLRAYRPYVKGSMRKRLRDRLRALADATSTGRDAEVLAAWARAQLPSLTARERTGGRWLLARLDERRALGERVAELRRDFAKAERRLRQRLQTYRLTVDVGRAPGGATLAVAMAEAVRAQAAELEARLAGDAGEPAQIHAARVAGKRLRYTLEPAAARADVAALVERLKDLQDVLGELNDAHVAGRELAAAVEDAGAERARALYQQALDAPDVTPRPGRRADQRPGLVALARRARERWTQGLRRLHADWSRSPAFFARVEAVAAALEAGAAPAPPHAPPARAPRPREPARRGWRARVDAPEG
jgi:CHAD domain-containing protein